ncbi:MAG: hypothetical protein IPH06_06710 [Alphaproteobacteria bacterium]|nr:hypothetical protein [Alphaproteobacteria bacterium]QQS57709.1 MAG: hypothetical protein IPN28_02475 [Alphaproteobacteria bacterium]
MKIEDLVQEIHRCFGNADYPGDDRITDRDKFDDEAKDIKEAFQGVRWQEITLTWLQDTFRGDKGAVLVLMSEAGALYYIPAFMMICIKDLEESDTAYDSLIKYLTLTSYNEAEFLSAFKNIEKEKGACIAHFLLKMKEMTSGSIASDDARCAYESYWKKYITE